MACIFHLKPSFADLKSRETREMPMSMPTSTSTSTSTSVSIDNSQQPADGQYHHSLEEKVNHLEQEARMVLPGIQALFGFQLIAVFNQGFHEHLNHSEKMIHLTALFLISISAAMVMAPAAYHRQAHHQISEHFIRISSRFLAFAMLPLALGICLDIYLISRMITESMKASLILASSIFIFYFWIWFLFPRLQNRKSRQNPHWVYINNGGSQDF